MEAATQDEAVADDDRISVTEMMLLSRESFIARLGRLADGVEILGRKLADSDWPPPAEDPLDEREPDPLLPPRSERH